MDEDQKAEPHDIRDDEPQGLYFAEDEELFGGDVSHSSRSVQAPLPLSDAAAFTGSVFGDGADRAFDLPANLGSYSVSEFAQTERSSDSVRAAEPAVFDIHQDTWRSLHNAGDVMAMRRPTAGLDGPHELFLPGDKLLEAAVEPQPQATAVQQRRPQESANGNLAVPALPPYYRLETHTHTKLVLGTDRAAVGSAIDTIGEALRAENVDLEFQAEKCKWKCCFFLNTVCVFFQVRLWKNEASPRAGEHVLEFQRRHGDGGPFMGFWRKTLVALGVRTSGLAPRSGAPALTRASTTASLPMPSLVAAPSLLAPPPPLASTTMPIPAQLLPTGPSAAPPVAGAPSEDDMAGVVNPFKEMVKSGLPDAALAGARGLAQLSACKDNRMVMKQCSVVETLVNFMTLSHKPHECLYFASAQIFAVACLANLSEEPVVQSSLYRSCGLLLDQVDNGCWRDRAMRREAARTLRNLAQDDQGTDSIIRQVGKERLQQWCQDTYPQLSDQSIISDAGIVSERIRSRWAVCV